MRVHDATDNLFTRLFSYTPRENREPLEDFCTETLAWCLRNCREFRNRFFKNFPAALDNPDVRIVTQQSYRNDEQDADASEGAIAAISRGRFDMVVRSEMGKILVAVENKVWSDFGKDQLEKYRRRLNSVKRTSSIRRCLLVTITAFGCKPDRVDKHVRWSQVHIALEKAACECQDRFLREVCHHFAAFLKEKGLAPMKLKMPTAEMLRHFNDALKYREDLEKVLKPLREQKPLETYLKRKQVVVEPFSNETYIGIYGRRQTPQFYLGFHLFDAKSPKIAAIVAVSARGKKTPNRTLGLRRSKYQSDGDEIWYECRQPLKGHFSRDGDKLSEWFFEKSKAVVVQYLNKLVKT